MGGGVSRSQVIRTPVLVQTRVGGENNFTLESPGLHPRESMTTGFT